jgi:DivIVA domain-containing protein
MSEAYEDRPDRTIPAGRALTSEDLQRVRFSSALRGYRMDEVDALIDRIAADLVAREADARPATRGSEDTSTPADDSTSPADPATTSTESSVAADDASADDTSPEGHDEPAAEPDSPDESTRHRDAGSAGAATGSTPS